MSAWISWHLPSIQSPSKQNYTSLPWFPTILLTWLHIWADKYEITFMINREKKVISIIKGANKITHNSPPYNTKTCIFTWTNLSITISSSLLVKIWPSTEFRQMPSWHLGCMVHCLGHLDIWAVWCFVLSMFFQKYGGLHCDAWNDKTTVKNKGSHNPLHCIEVWFKEHMRRSWTFGQLT